jgi:hypothetical protein
MSMVTVRDLAGGSPVDVVRGILTMPRLGAWQAALWLDADAAPAGKVEISAGSLTLIGTAYRPHDDGGNLHEQGGLVRLRVVAGAGGLRKLARAKHYVSPTGRLVLAELAGDAGEAVSPTADASVLGATLVPAWTTMGLETGPMITALCEELAPEASWRLLPDGTIWVGNETWPAADLGDDDPVQIDENPEEGWVTLAMDIPRLLPGTRVGWRKADLVEHVIEAGDYFAKVWLAQ